MYSIFLFSKTKYFCNVKYTFVFTSYYGNKNGLIDYRKIKHKYLNFIKI